MKTLLPLTAVELLFRNVPPFVGARALTLGLRASGVKMGRTSAFWGMPSFGGGGAPEALLSIGEHCGFNLGCYFELDAPIAIADHVSVGHEVLFLTTTRESRDPLRRGTAAGGMPITVEAGVWIGSRSIIHPGVTIGAGSVIAASAIVKDSVPANTLFTGTRKISIAKWR
jgi:maltose O-acetyltransferase